MVTGYLAPGWFPTEMTQDTMSGDATAAEILPRKCPMGRGGRSLTAPCCSASDAWPRRYAALM
jgi:hypothetical protein